MSQQNLLYLVYGMCIMFHFMMAWIFMRRRQSMAKHIIGVLMALVGLQYIKDLLLVDKFYGASLLFDHIAIMLDIVTVPLYGLSLIELCRPKSLTWRRVIISELPFVLMAVLFVCTHVELFFYMAVAMSVAYGTWCAVWTLRELPKYHRWLKEEFSYDEDINLHWLRGVMVFYFLILSVWAMSCFHSSCEFDICYMLFALVGWSFVCYFINEQEIVIKEVMDTCARDGCQPTAPSADSVEPSPVVSDIERRLHAVFVDDKIYLDPKLRLTDLAQRIGTNRTYLSQYFNQSAAHSFYAYVNEYRVECAKRLLRDTGYTLDVVASMSGFNSLSTFRRAFVQQVGVSPQQYRKEPGMEGGT